MLNHVRRGSGEPLVLIHGLGSQWQMWTPVLDRIAAERDVVALDLPGFGESPALQVDATVAALADAVGGLCDELGLERPHVAGNSLGGGLALELARSGRARTATAFSPIGFARRRERGFARTSLVASRATARVLDPALDIALRTGAGRALTMSQFYAKPWRISPAEAVRATRNLARSPGFAATLPNVEGFDWQHGDLDVPVTIAWGRRDRLLSHARAGARARSCAAHGTSGSRAAAMSRHGTIPSRSPACCWPGRATDVGRSRETRPDVLRGLRAGKTRQTVRTRLLAWLGAQPLHVQSRHAG